VRSARSRSSSAAKRTGDSARPSGSDSTSATRCRASTSGSVARRPRGRRSSRARSGPGWAEAIVWRNGVRELTGWVSACTRTGPASAPACSAARAARVTASARRPRAAASSAPAADRATPAAADRVTPPAASPRAAPSPAGSPLGAAPPSTARRAPVRARVASTSRSVRPATSTTRRAARAPSWCSSQPARPSSRWTSCSSVNQSRAPSRPRAGQNPPTPRRAAVRNARLPPGSVRCDGSNAPVAADVLRVNPAASASPSHAGRAPRRTVSGGAPIAATPADAAAHAACSAPSQPAPTSTSSST
jgi:hypothetical protein